MQPVLSLIIANVRSLFNKKNELLPRIYNLKTYKECDVLAFFETCLGENLPNEFVESISFKLYRLDRSFTHTGKNVVVVLRSSLTRIGARNLTSLFVTNIGVKI